MIFDFFNMYSLAVLGVVINNKKVLLAKRDDPDDPQFHNKWELPGGAVDDGETLSEAVLREVCEETGLKVKLISKLPAVTIGAMSNYAKSQGAQGHILLAYFCKVIGGELGKNIDNESSELKWFEYIDVPWEETLPGTKELISQLWV